VRYSFVKEILMKIIAALSFSLVLIFCSEPLFATETVPGEYRSPPVGTVLIFNQGESTIDRIKGVKVYSSGFNQGEGTKWNNHLTYHGMMSNWNCGGEPLKLNKSKFRSPWPLRVGETYSAKFAHEQTRCRATLEGRVLRTETVIVPAGTFFTYVLSEKDSLKYGTNTAISITTKWYSPRIGVFVKVSHEIIDCVPCAGGEEKLLLDIRYPSGYEEPARPTDTENSVAPKATSDERLRKLKDIYDKGLIDEDEYLAKINEIDGEDVTPLQGKLKLLKRAFEEGLLSQREYDEKKKKILDAL